MINPPSSKSRKRFGSFTPSNSRVEISDLPNSIIQCILEFLSVKDAIIFCTLSRQWDSLWKSMANLSFHCESIGLEEIRRFASFVDKVLMFYASTKIKKFSLTFTCIPDILFQPVESWLHFATTHEVEELCLDHQPKKRLRQLYELPRPRSNCPATKMIFATYYLYRRPENICWASLKILSLTEMRCTVEDIRAILLGSPSIESLTLRSCVFSGVERTIDASGTSLKELVIDSCIICSYAQINISAPNLLSLRVVGYFSTMMLKLLDVSSLTEATINLESTKYKVVANSQQKMLEGLLQKLSHVKKLKVGVWSFQALSIMKLNHETFPTPTCKILEIELKLMEAHIFGLRRLLLSCPDVQHLTINVITGGTSEANGKHKRSNHKMIQHELKDVYRDKCSIEKKKLFRHLKTIKITGFVAGSCPSSDKVLVKLVKDFLTNAIRLKKLIIHAEEEGSRLNPEKLLKLLEITETLLCFPRASPDAQVVFKTGQT